MHVSCAYHVLRLLSGFLVTAGWQPCEFYRALVGIGNKSI